VKAPVSKARGRRRKPQEYRTQPWQWSLAPSGELPDWGDKSADGDAEMFAWLSFKLDEELEAAAANLNSPENVARSHEYIERQRRERDMRQRREAERRESTFGPLVDELRSYGAPRYVIEWLQRYAEGRAKPTSGKRERPKATKEQRRTKARSEVWTAAQDVDRIEALWLAHFGRTNRSRGQMTAIDFAAWRWEPDDRTDWTDREEFRASIKNLRGRSEDRRLDRD
jgi:hypothetical protein